MPDDEVNDQIDDDSQNEAGEVEKLPKLRKVKTPGSSRFAPTTLAGNSEKKISALRSELENELEPRSYIERMYVGEMAAIIYEIQWLRRIKANIIRLAMQPALETVLRQLYTSPNSMQNVAQQREAKQIAAGWLGSRQDQVKVEQALTDFDLDEYAIEAEAWRMRRDDLLLLERLLAELEHRRDKVLLAVASYREFSERFKQTAQRLIEADVVTEERPELVS
jgi:hypothetical protein